MPRLTVTAIVICHKLEEYVDRAIASLTTQGRHADLVILLGTDYRHQTTDSLYCWRDHPNLKNVDIVISDEPLTCAQSKNQAAGRVGTDCFFTLDADDWVASTYVEKCMFMLEHGDEAAVGSDYYIVDPQGALMPAGLNKYEQPDIARINPMQSASIIRTEVFRAVGGYDESLIWEDWGLWTKFVAKGYKFCRYPAPLFYHQRHQTNKTNTDDKKEAMSQLANLRLDLGL